LKSFLFSRVEDFSISQRSARIALDRSMRRVDVDGRLHLDSCNISKAMICPYFGREIPEGTALRLEPEKIYYLLRDPAELAAAAPTFANLPLMIEHAIHSADDPKQDLAVGVIGSDVRFEDPYLKASLAVWTAEAIELIESEQQNQLSCGYRYRADMTPGTFQDSPYDGVMRDIVANHVALVANGRAGPDVIVSDSQILEFPRMKHSALIKRLKPFLAVDAKEEALDAEIEKVKAEDAEMKAAQDANYYGMTKDEWADADEDDKKKAKDKWAKDQAKDEKEDDEDDKKAKDEEPKKPEDGADKPAKDSAITLDSMNAAIAIASAKAVTEATTRINALHVALAAVQPVVGIVRGLDSAENVYAFALKQMGVDVSGVKDQSSYFTLFTEISKARGNKTQPRIATDSATVIDFPSMARIRLG
jgi:hypothetical protein